MEVLELLDAKGYAYVSKGEDEYAIVCPNAGNHEGGDDDKPSFSINVDKLMGHCFACGLSMNEAKLIRWLIGGELEDLSLQAMALRAKIKRIASVEDTSLSEARKIMMPPGEPWEEDGFRGISLETYRSLGAMKCNRGFYENRLVFPIHLEGELIGVDARALGEGQQPKYLRNKGSSCKTDWLHPFDRVKEMLANRLPGQPNSVIIAEGMFHAVNAIDKGFPALCFFGSNNFSSTKLRMILSLNVEEVIFFRDNDKAGFKAEQEICSVLSYWLPVSSAFTGHIEEGKDLGDLTKKQIEFAIANRGTPLIPSCLPDRHPKFGDRCSERRCPFIESGRCQNAIW